MAQLFTKNQLSKMNFRLHLPFQHSIRSIHHIEPHGYFEQVHCSHGKVTLAFSPFSKFGFYRKFGFKETVVLALAFLSESQG